ncbi:MAG: DUF262 domain-containing protein [Microscillaceae bacterium]|nr:DUF262 domain-containing protein [Microscillaceae bacterium]
MSNSNKQINSDQELNNNISKPVSLGHELNNEILPDIKVKKIENIIRYDRNWTIETIFNQIENGNIDLNPKFQRRNAWDDEKKNRLIESIFLNYPIPEIVLAEHPTKRQSFIVIDGKQRLLTLIGFINSEKYPFWKKPKLQGLTVRKDLEGKTYKDLEKDEDLIRIFLNTDMRCAITTNIPENNGLLYDMFYRLNAGSEPLTFQELRQALYRGEFSDFLINKTNDLQSFQQVMGLEEPDNRLEDVEILLRFFAVYFFGHEYRSSLKDFLDMTMEKLNYKWEKENYKDKVLDVYSKINLSIQRLEKVFGKKSEIARLPNSSKFNKALFEVQVYYFLFVEEEYLTDELIKKFKLVFNNSYIDANYAKSLTQGTNTLGSLKNRFDNFRKLLNNSFGLNLSQKPY